MEASVDFEKLCVSRGLTQGSVFLRHLSHLSGCIPESDAWDWLVFHPSHKIVQLLPVRDAVSLEPLGRWGNPAVITFRIINSLQSRKVLNKGMTFHRPVRESPGKERCCSLFKASFFGTLFSFFTYSSNLELFYSSIFAKKVELVTFSGPG